MKECKMMYYDSQGNDGLRYSVLMKYISVYYRSVFHIMHFAWFRDYLSRQSIMRRDEVIDWKTWNILTKMVCSIAFRKSN